MTETPAHHDGVLQQILSSLGMTTDHTEKSAESDAYRIEFEHNFTVEIQQLPDNACRVSARIISLGKSLQVQETQLGEAMKIFTEVLEDLPTGMSLAISDHDNCLRMCFEIAAQSCDAVLLHFNGFVQTAFAYKQTYFKHKGQLT